MTEKNDTIKKELVSVIMGNYNTPVKYLKEAIDSVLSQTYQNFEFIIVDDCSTDNSLDVIKSYDDPRIKVLCNEKNLGLAASMNKALDVCQGEFVARMDTDDICYPHRFERQVAYIREHPDVVVCATQVTMIDENGDSPRGDWRMNCYPDMEIYRIHLLFSNDHVTIHPSVMFNRRHLLKYDLRYNENYRYAQDYRLWVDCSKCAVCCSIPEVLLKHRIHSASVSKSKRLEQKECDFRIVQEQLDPLHLKLDKEIWPLHYRYFQEIKPYDRRLKKWLKEIIKANKKYQVYNHTKLKKKIRRRCWKICYYHFIKRQGQTGNALRG